VNVAEIVIVVVGDALSRGLKVLGVLSNDSWRGGQTDWTANNAEECIAGLRGMAEHLMKDIEVHVMAVDGSDVLTWFDLHTGTTDPIPTVNWSHVEDGLITRIRVTFDPRPLMPS